MRILGIDLGDKTIGLAVSDPTGLFSQPVKTLNRIGIKKDIEAVKEVITEYQIEKIVIGLPRNMNGSLGPQSEKIMQFANSLKEVTGLEVVLWDERLTTVAAEKVLLEADLSRKKRKRVIDSVAASIILQGYLESQR
ncbi:MAG: Holliday junction resolvase RuvX [Thermoanaerobacteraceae bacterium]|nr:Holliday junction resolvase RuvX [Thermoanaerobacteraceae bacterium]